MRIGVDFDGTLVDTVEFLLARGEEYFGKPPVERDGYDVTDMFGVSREASWEFWTAYAEEYMTEIAIRPGAAEVMRGWKEQGEEVFIVTARGNPWFGGETSGRVKELTKEWLKNNGVAYDGIIWAKNGKLELCQENRIELMIEDHEHNIRELATAMPVIRLECGHNRGVEGRNIYACKDWTEVQEMVEKIKKENLNS